MYWLILVAQFSTYLQQDWGKAEYAWLNYDFNGDGHRDAYVYYGDSICLYTLPDATKRANYVASPYSQVNLSYAYGNRDVIVFKYTLSGDVYRGKLYYYTDYNVLTWESTEIVSYYYYSIFPVIFDVDGDGKIDIVITRKKADSSLQTIVYKGEMSGTREVHGEVKKVDGFNLNVIKVHLTQSGRYRLVLYDKKGSVVGTYYFAGFRGLNKIIPPFTPSAGISFYEIWRGNTFINKGKFLVVH